MSTLHCTAHALKDGACGRGKRIASGNAPSRLHRSAQILEPIKRQVALLALLAQLKTAAKEREITHDQIAEKVGWTRSNVSRVLRGAYMPRLDNFIKLAEAIGVKIKIK